MNECSPGRAVLAASQPPVYTTHTHPSKAQCARICFHPDHPQRDRRAHHHRPRPQLCNGSSSFAAHHDQLTGALNRYRYHSPRTGGQAEPALRSPLSLLLFDIDNFKASTTPHGHKAEMQSGRSGADRLGADPGQRFSVRVGGEEFVVIAVESDCKSGGVMAEKLRGTIQEHNFKTTGRITVSFASPNWAPMRIRIHSSSGPTPALYRRQAGGSQQGFRARGRRPIGAERTGLMRRFEVEINSGVCDRKIRFTGVEQ